MENYKEKCEQYLERAKKEIKECGDNQGRINMIKRIFPELRESEDEKIRKAQLNYWRSVGGKEWYGVPVQETIAWLEKQGERKTPQRMIDFLDSYRRKIGCSLDYDEARDVDGRILCIKEWLEKQGEQKPADEEEKLTEFEKKLKIIISDASHWTSDDGNISTYCQFGDKEIKKISGQLLDLARKELETNYYTKVLDDRMVFKSDLHDRELQTAYDMGKQDALKDLPKWKKITKSEQNYLVYGYLSNDEYYLSIKELIENLPKEE